MYDINKEVSIYKVVIYDNYYMFQQNIDPVIIFYLYFTDVQNEEGVGVLGEYTTIECIMVKPNCLEHRSAIRNHHYVNMSNTCLLYTSPSPRDGLPSPRDGLLSRMPSS